MATLEIANLKKSFGGLDVIQDISFRVEAGERRLIIGPNGAGKTTLFNLIAGDIRPSHGSIALAGDDISRLPTFRRAACGIGRTFQILTLFSRQTVIRNVILAMLGSDARRWNPLIPIDRDAGLRQRASAILSTVLLDHCLLYTSPVQNIYIRRTEKKNGRLMNTVIKSYPQVSQFWNYDPRAFLSAPVYSRNDPTKI